MNVAEVFYFALKAVMHPSAPLFDAQNDSLRPACLKALKRIFRHCDLNCDGFLDDNELNEFQKKCFNKTLSDEEIVAIKETVKEQLPEGVVLEKGISEAGFLVLNRLFVQRGRLETTWTILRTFGYDDELRIDVPDLQLSADTLLEFSNFGVKKLVELFDRFARGKNFLTSQELNHLFSLTEDNRNPWFDQYPATAELTDNNKHLPLESYLAQWMLFIYELPYEAVRSFCELFHPRMVKRAFKAVSFEKYWNRKIFKVAILSTVRVFRLILSFGNLGRRITAAI
jgi:mitochondrial Rho GTPase 1